MKAVGLEWLLLLCQDMPFIQRSDNAANRFALCIPLVNFLHNRGGQWINTKQLKEQLWLGTEYEVGGALRGLDKPLYLAQIRPLGAFWCEFGKSSADGWTETVWALCGALSARRAERETQEQKTTEVLSQLTEGNVAALYATIQIWEMYLRCCRGRDKRKAENAFRDYAQLLILPFGEYSPEMANWKREKPVVPVWNHREDAKLEIWYPHGEVPFECAVVSGSLRPALIYYRQRILDAAPAANAGGCSSLRMPAAIYAANGVVKPVKRWQKRVSTANPERKSTSRLTSGSICSGTTASRSWKRILLRRNSSKGQNPLSGSSEKKPWNVKKQIQNGALSTTQFINWMIGQEPIIHEICGE